MKKIKILKITLVSWILLIILSVAWLFFLLLNNIHVILTNILFLFVLIIACLSFTLSLFFIYQIIIDVKVEIKKAKDMEKNISDMYQYDKLADPPLMYT